MSDSIRRLLEEYRDVIKRMAVRPQTKAERAKLEKKVAEINEALMSLGSA